MRQEASQLALESVHLLMALKYMELFLLPEEGSPLAAEAAELFPVDQTSKWLSTLADALLAPPAAHSGGSTRCIAQRRLRMLPLHVCRAAP